jgi:hypothetical protein
MGKRMLTVSVAILVAAALGTGGVVLAAKRAQREPAALPGLQVQGDQSAPTASPDGAGAGQRQGPAPQPVAPGQMRYEVRGKLPELASSARAWTLDQSVSRAAVAELAARLGLSGQPREEELAWTVGDGARQLRVSKIPGVPWTFGTFRTICGGPLPGGVAPKSRGMACATVAPEVPTVTPAQLPDRATAERAARDLLGRTGLELDGADVRLTRGFDRWLVLVSPRVGGMPTSAFSWSVGIGPHAAVLSAQGWLATPRPGDTYPLITVREALQRLRQRQLPGPLAVDAAKPLPAPVRRECRLADHPPTTCGPARAPSTLTVTDVRLGLQLASVLASADGRRVDYLVPAYFFQIEGTWERQVTVIAVQDRFLTAPPAPTVVPEQRTRVSRDQPVTGPTPTTGR